MKTSRLTCSLVAAVVLSSAAGYAGGDHPGINNPDADNNETATRDFSRHNQVRGFMEHGLNGSRKRKPARTFSGRPEYPIDAVNGAKRGGPDEDDSPRASGSAGSDRETVEIQSARFATLEPIEGATASGGMAPASFGDHPQSLVATMSMDPRSQMISPVNGSTLAAVQTFVWTRGSAVADHFLWVGSCFECNDLADQDERQNLSQNVRLPTDGRLIFVTLFSFINGNWYSIDYQYLASNGQPLPAQMLSPSNGSTLGAPQRFVWNAGYSVNGFYLRIGSCQGCRDLLDENEGFYQSRTIYLPADGRTIYVRLYSSIRGAWWYYDYQYRAPLSQRSSNVRVNVTNQLGYAMNISINGQLVGSVPAYTTAGTNVNVSSLTVAFDVIQPELQGRVLGDAMSGVFQRIDGPSGTYNFVAGNHIGNTYYFLPLLTNQTSFPLAIEVNGGLEAENRCNCVAPAYSTRVGAGYYRFYSNSNVRLFRAGSNYSGSYVFFGTDANGTVSGGGPLTKWVAAGSGTVELTATFAP